MKRYLLGLVALSFFSANAQTVDEIVQKYAANLGGIDAFNKVKTAKMTGTVTAQGNDISITIQVINGKAIRTDAEVMGNQIINVYKDGKGWKQNAFIGAATPTDATEAEIAELKQQSMLAPALGDYKARGHKVELLGQEDVEGVKCFKLKMTNKETGKESTLYISTTDYALVKSVTEREMMGQTIPVESYYSNLKEYGGLKFYMTVTQKVDGQEFQTVNLENVQLNVPIDEKVFDKP